MATYTVSSDSQLLKAVISSCEVILNKVADKVAERINQEIETYYAEYSPEILYGMKTFWYDRTNQLRNCCKISPIIKGINNISVEIYLDVDSLNYSTSGADPWKTVVAADHSLHGGWIINHGVAVEQVPWEEISNDTNYGDIDSAGIWSKPMKELLEDGKLRKYFLEEARNIGLNIIAK